MRLRYGPVIAALLVSPPLPARGVDHLLFTEFAVTPTNAEFVEIYNPTAQVVDLSNYYISDFVLANVTNAARQNYWRLVDGELQPDPNFANDFLVRFPPGATILPGQTIVVAIHDDLAFTDQWSGRGRIVRPDYELAQDGNADGVPDMVDPGPERVDQPLIQSGAGLTNGTEAVVLFYWDGESDLVQDVDIVQWQAVGGTSNTVFPNKTGVRIDGPDPGTEPSTYRNDTPPASQQVASNLSTAHDFGLTVSRVRFDEGTETLVDGNGITGNDETSENLAFTWKPNTSPSIGSLGDFGPLSLLAGAARAADVFVLEFSRRLDAATASDPAHYSVLQILTPGGEPSRVSLRVRGAELGADGRTVSIRTDPQTPLALYEVRAEGILSEDREEALAAGARVLVRGFNPGPGVRLVVPRRPYVPAFDGNLEIAYEAPQGENILLRLFDPSGRELFVLADEAAPPGGLRTIRWDGRDRLRQRLPAGVYTLHLEAPRTGEATAVPIVVAVPDEETLR